MTKEYNTALPDSNQSKVLRDVQVMARGPRWAEIGQDARTVTPQDDEETGTMKTGQTEPTLAVPGIPHYGGEGGNESASSNAS